MFSNISCLIKHVVLCSSSELALELPFESAALLSLIGVNCLIANQWNCKLRENKERLHKMMEGKEVNSSLL